MSGFFHAPSASADAMTLVKSAADTLRDCPVMSGFFHAQIGLEAEDAENALQDTCDCPVMSGFFHALRLTENL